MCKKIETWLRLFDSKQYSLTPTNYSILIAPTLHRLLPIEIYTSNLPAHENENTKPGSLLRFRKRHNYAPTLPPNTATPVSLSHVRQSTGASNKWSPHLSAAHVPYRSVIIRFTVVILYCDSRRQKKNNPCHLKRDSP